jgi:cell division initiation protein
MRITPLDVHEQTFRVSFRGFDPAEVDAFLQRVADELERLTEERDQLQAQVEKESAARENLEQALANARALQQGFLEQARQEAEILVNRAQLKADRILSRANEELVSLRREAQVLGEKRGLWLGELAAMAGTLQDWAEHKTRQQYSSLELIVNHREQVESGAETEASVEGDDPVDEKHLASAVEALDELFSPDEDGPDEGTPVDAD